MADGSHLEFHRKKNLTTSNDRHIEFGKDISERDRHLCLISKWRSDRHLEFLSEVSAKDVTNR